MEKLFVEKNRTNTISYLLFGILVIITLGVAFILFYDEILEKNYMTNRRRLIKAIKNGEVSLVKRELPDPDYFSDIEMYNLTHGEDVYDLWLWTRRDGVVKVSVGDHIGLFTSTFFAKRLNDKLVKVIKEHANG